MWSEIMNKITNLMDLKNNSPFIRIIVAETELELQVFFSMNCCEAFFEYHEQGDSFRTAFAKSVFHMYKQQKDIKDIFTENDFVGITDTDLTLILDMILEQDNKVKLEYEKIDCINVYEKFYIANKEVLKSITSGISKSFELQNKSLINSISNAISNVIIPAESLSNFASTVTKALYFDFDPFQSALNSIVENLHVVNENLIQPLSDSILQMSKAAQNIISSIDFSLIAYHKEWSEQRETLLMYGWFYSDEIPEELISSIHIKREELSIEDVDKIIIDYFRQNRCEALKKMVKRWETLDYFHCRERIFHEALVNHSRKYFNSSVTLLTIHTEGIITDFVRTNLKNPRYKVQNALKDIKTELNENQDVSIYEFEVYSDVIERIEEAFNESFNHADPDTASNKSRHKIAHGHAYEIENEVNSLKRFLYLNEIHCLFSKLSNLE